MLTKPKPGVGINPLHPLSKGLVGFWLFNEGAGNKAYDISRNENHGVLINMLPNVQGSGWGGSKFGGGLSFDGTDDYVDTSFIPNDEIIEAFTISVWMKGYADGAGIGSYTTNRFYLRGEHEDEVRFGIGATSFETANSPYDHSKWNFVVATYDGSNVAKIYIDSIEKANHNVGIQGAYSTTSFKIGGNDPSAFLKYFNGSLDNIRIYNCALSVNEVKQLYSDPFCNMMKVRARQYYVLPYSSYYVNLQLTQAIQLAHDGLADTEGALTLSEALSIVMVGQVDSNASILLSSGNMVSLSASAIADSTLILAVVIALSHVGQTDASSALSLTHVASLSPTGQATVEAALSLGYQNTIANISNSTLSAQLALAISAGMSASSTLAISEDISLSQTLNIQSIANAEIEGEVSFDQILALTILGEAISLATLSLNEIKSVTLTATTVEILLGSISDPTIVSITKKRTFQHTTYT